MHEEENMENKSSNDGRSQKEAEVVGKDLQAKDLEEGKEVLEPESATPDVAEDVADEITRLKAARDEAQAKADEYLDGWQRARAELSNYRKRVDREKQGQYARIVSEILGRYLDVMDDLERALADIPESSETANWAKGIGMIHSKFKNILDAEGVEIIEPLGESFDPNFHEAISNEESDSHEEGEVIEVVQKGYKLEDRVIRPAMVRVAK
jgi:molecular chaperone GrpE